MNQVESGGDKPITDGMHIAVRLRRDFTVTSAERLLRAARPAYVYLYPGTTDSEAESIVTTAAEAIFTTLERDGLLGDGVDGTLGARANDGLQVGGWRAQVTVDEPSPLPAGPDCVARGDVFALPPDA
jgi:hypothetical protein